MDTFKPQYEVFGQLFHCTVIQLPNPIKLETDVYKWIKKFVQSEGWKYSRIDTTDQQGWPDITVLRKQEYNLIEGKLLKKKRLVDVADDIEFEFGQLPFMVRSSKLKINYTLAVGKGYQLAIIQGAYNPWKIVY